MTPFWRAGFQAHVSFPLQAMDRIHRLGQHRPVIVTKLVVEDSIESKIVQLQEKKMAMTTAALSRDPEESLGKLTPEDVSGGARRFSRGARADQTIWLNSQLSFLFKL